MTIPDEILNIQTPENVTFGYEIAGVGTRFLAALIDTALIVLLQTIVSLLVMLVFSLSPLAVLNGGKSAPALSTWAIAALGLISFLFLWGYYIFFEMIWNGTSPGKRALGLRVIRTDGTPVTLTESFVRNLVRLVDFLPAFYGIGVIAIFVNRQTRRLGDLAAGTVVVREANRAARRKNLADLEKTLAQPTRSAPAALEEAAPADAGSAYPVERLNTQDVQMIESFLLRRKELTTPGPLARQLAARLWARMQVSEPAPATGLEAEKTLEEILADYRRRHALG